MLIINNTLGRFLFLSKVITVISFFVVQITSQIFVGLSIISFLLSNNFKKKGDYLFKGLLATLSCIFLINCLIHIDISAGLGMNVLTESKFLIFMLSLFFLRKSELSLRKNFIERQNNIFSDIFIYASFTYIFVSYVNYGRFFRFPDYVLFSSDINSAYYGFLALVLISISKDFYYFLVLSFLLLLSGSGAGLLGYFFVLFNRRKSFLLRSRKQNFLLFMTLLLLTLTFFLWAQFLRGRSFFHLMEIDRINLAYGYILYLIENLNIYSALFGNGPFVLLVDMLKFVPSDAVRNYLQVEPGILGAKVLHNDFFRIFHTYGLLGIVSLFVFFRKINSPWMLPLSISALFGSPFYSTPIIFFLNFLNLDLIIKNEKN